MSSFIQFSKGFFCKVVKPTPTLVLHVLCFNKKKRKETKIRKKEKERKKKKERKKEKKEREKERKIKKDKKEIKKERRAVPSLNLN